LLGTLRALGAGPLTVGDRSGKGNTRAVMEEKDVFRIARDFDAEVLAVDELGASDWELIQPPGSHWRHGFALPRLGPEGYALLTELLEGLQATVVPFDEGLARLAHDGWLRFGRGRHPPGLNLGDCFAYALAKQCGEPLLFKGEDFARTDLAAAL